MGRDVGRKEDMVKTCESSHLFLSEIRSKVTHKEQGAVGEWWRFEGKLE